MVDANVGSTCGLTVVVSVGLGGGVGVLFLPQEEKIITIKKTLAIKLIPAFVILGNLFIICVRIFSFFR